jgi:hypothetical protein
VASRHSTAADLVRSMARANRVNSTHIHTVLAHVPDQTGILEALLDDAVLHEPLGVDLHDASTVEAFACDLRGVGFLGLTFSMRAGPDRDIPLTSVLDKVSPGRLHLRRSMPEALRQSSLAIFDTTRRATSVFDGTTNVEFLIQLDAPAAGAGAGPSAVPVGGVCFRDCARQVSGLAAKMGRPLSFVHSPVAAPCPAREPRGVTGPCLRFGVAFPRSDDSSRLQFGADLVEICCERGFGLWQRGTMGADAPHDYWQEVVPVDPTSGASVLATRRPAEQGLAVTCVGPARSGVTEALLDLLDAAGAPLAGMAETTLDDLAIVNLLTVTPRSAKDVEALPADAPAGAVVAQALGLGPAARIGGALRDFRCVVSVQPERARDPNLVAVWVAWAIPASPDALRSTVRTVRRALDKMSERYRTAAAPPPSDAHLNIEYLICREVSVDWLRGRMKVAVDLDTLDRLRDDEGGVPVDKLGQFCSDVERQWRADLAFALGTAHVDLDVVWRESWIGRWATLHVDHIEEIE